MGDIMPTKDKSYYLAGPMSGIPEYNFPAFERACELLRGERGLTIKSPHEIDHGETPETRGSLPYQTYLRAGYRLVLECDGMIMLPGWETSKGTQMEYQIARSLKIPVFQIMTLDHRWWTDEAYSPILFLEERVTRILETKF